MRALTLLARRVHSKAAAGRRPDAVVGVAGDGRIGAGRAAKSLRLAVYQSKGWGCCWTEERMSGGRQTH